MSQDINQQKKPSPVIRQTTHHENLLPPPHQNPVAANAARARQAHQEGLARAERQRRERENAAGWAI